MRKVKKGKLRMKEILLTYKKGKATAKIACLVSEDTQAKPKKPKVLFFSQCSGRNNRIKSNFAYIRALHRQENE